MTKLVLLVALAVQLFLVSVPPALALPPPKDWSNNEWYQFFEAAVTTVVAEGPGHVAKEFGGVSAAPIMDVYSALSGVGSAVKPGLLSWLRRKAEAAALAGDVERGNKYQAYETALANEDNSRLKELLNEYERAKAKSRSALSAQQAPWRKMVGRWRTQSGNTMRIYYGDPDELVAAYEYIKPDYNYAVKAGDLSFTHGFADAPNSVKSDRGLCYGLKGDGIKVHQNCKVRMTISPDAQSISVTRQDFQYPIGGKEWLSTFVMNNYTYTRVGD